MLLEARGLRLYYESLRGHVRAVDGVGFGLERGETLGIVGESGCGKTSVGLAIMRLLPGNVALFEGSVMLDGVEILEMPEEEFRREVRWRRLSMVFQGAMNSLNPVLKVGFQVAEPLMIHKGMRKEEAIELAGDIFELVGLPRSLIDRYPHELSGGMKQRVVIAMALIMNPDIVILDEPTSALDVVVQAQITNLLKRLKRERDLSMIFITHDIALASDLCDRIAVMYGGRISELGSAEQVLLDPIHPYTRKLIASSPRLRVDLMPEFIPGTPPDLVNPPEGCRFRPRCPYAMEICRRDPPMIEVNGRFVACWLYGDKVG